MAESISHAQFFAEGKPDGNVDFGINDGRGRPIIRAPLTPEEISGFVTELLSASHSAVVRSGVSVASLSDPETVKPCPLNAMNIGHKKGQGGLVMIARVGKAKIAFEVPEAEALNLARSFIKAATTSHSPLSTWALFRRVFADFFSGLRGFGAVFSARFSAASRRRVISSWSSLSGRSFRRFRSIKLSPGSPVATFDPVGECIYCGSNATLRHLGGSTLVLNI